MTAGGLILFVQAPDIYKEEARREDSSHTQKRTPERNDQKGAAQHPEKTNELRGQDRVKRKREEEKRKTTLQYLR